MDQKNNDHHDDDDSQDAPGGQPKKITFKENKMLFIKHTIMSALKFIWNNQKKQFLGRDGEEWGKLGAFYVVFYICIGFYTWAIMAIFMAITNTNTIKPMYTGKRSSLGSSTFSPGMGVRPHFGTGKASISFSMKDPASYVDFLNLYLEPFENDIKYAINCSDKRYADPKTGCRYDVFSYLNEVDCGKNQSYGYKAGLPCVLVKLNNLFNWVPTGVEFPPSSAYGSPNCFNKTLTPVETNTSYIYVTCQGQGSSDEKNINSITYVSPYGIDNCIAGIPFYFYPYENQENYMQPQIVLKLNLTRDVTVNMQCSSYAKNLVLNERKSLGFTQFSVTVNN